MKTLGYNLRIFVLLFSFLSFFAGYLDIKLYLILLIFFFSKPLIKWFDFCNKFSFCFILLNINFLWVLKWNWNFKHLLLFSKQLQNNYEIIKKINSINQFKSYQNTKSKHHYKIGPETVYDMKNVTFVALSQIKSNQTKKQIKGFTQNCTPFWTIYIRRTHILRSLRFPIIRHLSSRSKMFR